MAFTPESLRVAGLAALESYAGSGTIGGLDRCYFMNRQWLQELEYRKMYEGNWETPMGEDKQEVRDFSRHGTPWSGRKERCAS